MTKKNLKSDKKDSILETAEEVSLDEVFDTDTHEEEEIHMELEPTLEALDELESLDNLSDIAADLLPLSLDLLDEDAMFDDFEDDEADAFSEFHDDEDDEEGDQFGSLGGVSKKDR